MRSNSRRWYLVPGWIAAASAAALIVPFTAAAPGMAAEPEPATAEQAAGRWSSAALGQLINAIEASRAEGLNPADYGAAELRRAAADGQGPALDALATRSALALANDYYFGRVADRGNMQWMIDRSADERAQLPARLAAAVDARKLDEFFTALLPSDERYQALKAALADASGADRDRLRVNMERWRWMPRSIATDYLYVNVPSYQLKVVQDGVQLSSYDVVVGARSTPTPQMVSPTGSLVVNPSWYVPRSIIKTSNLRPGRGGYIYKASAGGGYSVVQPPGPRNALGKIKFNLANNQAIYLHDTNAKSAFARSERALSHGCVRVKDIDRLAAELMSQGGDDSALDQALARSRTATLHLPQTWPVYIVYFTADVEEGGTVATYGDPYGYDARVLAGLGGKSAPDKSLPGKPIEVASN
ncbi:L,D-transpeptidase family protein [Sphingomonas sp. ASY06-1R]|uniref:L,D-transpeptidase family protein n=1 Tax=Sphingomonas sp. ASY06-1R TaxID=3445771 RepID=UPI003FA23FBA